MGIGVRFVMMDGVMQMLRLSVINLVTPVRELLAFSLHSILDGDAFLKLHAVVG